MSKDIIIIPDLQVKKGVAYRTDSSKFRVTITVNGIKTM